MYQVLARKWRPQTFADLVGQPHVVRTLSNAIESDRVAHAYIFAGLRGTGKTTVARILAKCLNCVKGPTTEPCGSCEACTEIAESRALDVLEIDAASRTKVEQTRELLEVVSYAPSRDRHRVLIIDEAHMLSKASFNALLKTLEEPPPRVVFILATTELHKVVPTILSRCQVFEFRRVSVRELAAHLRQVCDAEGIQISNEALDRLARAGEGSVRDSLSALERAVAFCGKAVHDDDVLRMLGAVRSEVLVELIAALARRDAAAMLSVLDSLIDEGHDLTHFWTELVCALRDLLLLRTLPDRTELLSRSTEDARRIEQAAAGLSREDLTRAFQILADLEFGLKSSSQPQFVFEVTLIRLASLGSVKPIEEVLGSLGDAPARAVTVTAHAAASEPPKKKRVEGSPSGAGDLLTAIRDARPMLGAVLEQATQIRLAGGHLSVVFPVGKEAFKRQIEQADSLRLLQEQAARLAGGPVKVSVDVDRPAERPAPAATRAPREREPSAAPGGRSDPASRLIEQARQEPGVERLLTTFGAQVLDIRPFEARQDPGIESAPAETLEENP